MKNYNSMSGFKIGLVLPGGGARGSYQLGVMLAMKKFGLIKNVSALSGGSIGSFSIISFLMDDFRKAYYTFKSMNSQRVLGYKDGLKNKVPIRGRGLFSRAPLVSFIDKYFDLAKYVNTDIPLYVSVAKVEKHKLKSYYSPAYFKINNLSHERVTSILLASSAIPRVFDEVKIAGNTYVDCLKADNEPFLPLLAYDLDALFVIPLTSSHDIKKYADVNIPVVDFESLELRNSPLLNMIGFEEEKVDLYLNCGYFNAVALLQSLFKNAKNFKKGKFQLPRYSSLVTENIKIVPYRILNIDEILSDVEKGA